MPSQLYKNSAIYFMCARDFLWDGVEYKMGDDFDQDISPGRIDLLVRTRRLVAVVDDIADKPRHWHHHVWLRKDVTRKLGLIHRENTDILEGSSLYNREKQNDLSFSSVETIPAKKWEDQDMAAKINAEAVARAATEEVLDDENAEELSDGCVGEHDPTSNPDCDHGPAEPQNVVGEPAETDDEDEPAITEDDLWDPTDHTVQQVLDYLAGDISEAEFDRVVAVEKANKNRAGVINNV